MNELTGRLLAVLALVAANAFFVAAEFALVASRRTKIEAMVRRGDRQARTVKKALGDLYRLLSATQLGITLTSILLGYVAEEAVAHAFREWFSALPPSLEFLTRGGIASVIAVAVISYLHVVLGELIPKTWAITYPEATSRWVAAPLIVFSWVTRPFNFVLNWSARTLLRFLGIRSTNPEADRAFRYSISTFRRMTQTEIDSAKPLRLRVVTVTPGDTAERMAARMPLVDRPLERFLILNGLNQGDPLKPGDRVKIVTE